MQCNAPQPRPPAPVGAGLMAIIRNPDARTLAVLYREGITYSLIPGFLVDQMLQIPGEIN